MSRQGTNTTEVPATIERFGVEIIADEVIFLSYGKSRRQQQAGSQDNEDDDVPF